MSSISIIDLVFFIVAFIFILTAFLRGFVKEVFALLNWIMAITFSHLLAPYVSKLFMFYTKSAVVADISARTLIFIIVFVATLFLTKDLSHDLKEKVPNSFDKSLGVLFGIIKTLLVFGVIYSTTMNIGSFATRNKNFATEVGKSKWLTDAKTYNIIRMSGNIVDPVVKLFVDSIVTNFEKSMPKSHFMDDGLDGVNQKDELDQKIEEIAKEKTSDVMHDKNNNSTITKSTAPTDRDAGYSKKDIQKMDHLIDIVK